MILYKQILYIKYIMILYQTLYIEKPKPKYKDEYCVIS